MNFDQATQALIAGKYVRRSIWTVQDGYLALLPGIPYAWKILTQPNPNAGTYPFLIADFLAEDWEASDPCHDSKVLIKENVKEDTLEDAA